MTSPISEEGRFLAFICKRISHPRTIPPFPWKQTGRQPLNILHCQSVTSYMTGRRLWSCGTKNTTRRSLWTLSIFSGCPDTTVALRTRVWNLRGEAQFKQCVWLHRSPPGSLGTLHTHPSHLLPHLAQGDGCKKALVGFKDIRACQSVC